jgi:hypothetical protein
MRYVQKIRRRKMTAFELIEANGLTLHGDIEHFAELVRADERDRAMRENAYVLAEREACAAKAEQVGQYKNHIGIAAAIRARGEKS